jgi:thioredoxin reductase
MAVDTPARIAIVGAGPIGLEAALYARYLGYTVDVYERGRVVEHLRRWGHVRLFTPWEQNVSPLGVRALQTQDENWRPALPGECRTGHELVERYFLPLAASDLLADCIQENVEVVGIGREGLLKADLLLDDRRIDVPFRILLRDAEGNERTETADVVLDCSGTYGSPNWLGNGGLPAVGESACEERIKYGVPDVLGGDRARYAGQRTLVVGSGYSAATTVTALARLANEAADTQVVWVTRRERHDDGVGPIVQYANDPLAERDALAQQANLLTVERSRPIEHRPQTFVDGIAFEGATAKFQVEFSGRHAGHEEFDRVVANVGYRPDLRLFEELQVHTSFASDGPMKLAAALLKQSPEEARDGKPCGPPTLVNPEPDFYVLGAKSYGRSSNFFLSTGREQIRELFTIIGDREGLNLYASH